LINSNGEMRKFYLWLIIINLFQIQCKEPYNPVIDQSAKILVVDALITDEPVAQNIYLTWTIPFGGSGYFPETGAKISLIDSTGNSYFFTDAGQGQYVSDPSNLVLQYGKTYQLSVVTKDGNRFISSKQKLNPKGILNEMTAVRSQKAFQTFANSQPLVKYANGFELLVLMNTAGESSPYYRYSNNLLIEYSEKADTAGAQTSHCWRKYAMNQNFNINDNQISNPIEFQQDLGFCPVDSSFLGIVQEVAYKPPQPPLYDGVTPYLITKTLNYIIFTIKQYHINADVHQYYTEINSQLAAKDRILDPLAVQCLGNMVCTNKSDLQVLGRFELSSVQVKSYIFPFSLDQNVFFKNISPMDIDRLPESNCINNNYPSFWVYYK